MKICISSGHGAKIAGANDIIKEHEEAVRVVNKTAEFLRAAGVEVATFEDKTSTDQDTNLRTIVNWHNSQGPHDLDVSIHFNSSNGTTQKPIGTECWFYSSNSGMEKLARQIAEDMAGASGLIDRGEKPSSGLYFLVHTQEPAVLDEVCFVNSAEDCELYETHFDALCGALASALAGKEIEPIPPQPPGEELFYAKGKCSHFGGPSDTGVSPSEGLAFIYPDDNGEPDELHRFLFLPEQPAGTTGLARRLNAEHVFYVACRWDYDDTPKAMLANPNTQALVRANGKEFHAWPADWGPAGPESDHDTGRVADLSPGLMRALDLDTDDVVEVIYPAEQ